MKMKNTSKITVNGKEYNSLSEIPEEYKVVFGDKNNNGIPDFVEGILAGTQDMQNLNTNISGNSNINANFTSFFFNGSQYKSLQDLPPEARQKVEQGLKSFQNSGMKISAPLTNDSKQQNTPINQNPKQSDVMQELQPGFKFRVVMTIVLFILAVIYIFWLTKII